MSNSIYTPLNYAEELHATALALVSNGKGLLAADESTGSIEKRFKSVGKQNTEDNRREWRDLMFIAEGTLEDSLGGVILFEETLLKHQSTLPGSKYQGKSLVNVLKSRGIIPGIKTDKGTIPLPRTEPEETTTEGLDGLLERSQQYYEAGARFAKFRSTYTIGDTTPSQLAINNNAEIQARYASISQQAGLVPIVEPELLLTGDFTLKQSVEAHIAAYSALFYHLSLHRVDLAGLILKASMSLPGSESSKKASPEEVAQATLLILRTTVPPLVPGIVFLSGGQEEKEVIRNLNAINLEKKRLGAGAPWELTFSFGRALQGTAMEEWSKSGDIKKAQEVFVERVKWSKEAVLGTYQE